MCAVAAIGVAGQGSGVDPAIRLGLLATDLGIDPVPGGQPGGEYRFLNFIWIQSKASGNYVQQYYPKGTSISLERAELLLPLAQPQNIGQPSLWLGYPSSSR